MISRQKHANSVKRVDIGRSAVSVGRCLPGRRSFWDASVSWWCAAAGRRRPSTRSKQGFFNLSRTS